ncbi:MAG: glycoside hydrolase family 2, partial [Planctomycetes bacterium]|nr:glycoside hydrolase family 2 [Planctomycetota bacterium]
MRHVGCPLFLIALVAPLCLAPPCARAREVHDFNAAWRFARGPQPGAEVPAFDDQAWAQVRLPHDWAIAGPYEPQGDPHTGKLPWRGEGWYRKTFVLPAGAASHRVYLDFDGVMAKPKVYLNGHLAGGWDYGYQSFRIDATDHVRAGETNLVSVHVDTRAHQSRWYPGAGIYRKVELVVAELIHVAHWGTFVTTPEVSNALAKTQVRTTVENHLNQPATVDIETTLLSPRGRTVAVDRRTLRIESQVS